MAEDWFAGDDRTNRERMLAGDLYLGGDDPDSARLAQHAVQLADAYHRAAVADESAARPLLAELLGTLGQDAFIKPPLFVDYGENIHVGARTFANYNLVALDVATITIGEDCMIGPNVQLLTPTHPIDPVPRRAHLEAALPITIGDNVWIGGGVIVCPGVTIGDNSVIGGKIDGFASGFWRRPGRRGLRWPTSGGSRTSSPSCFLSYGVILGMRLIAKT